MLERAAAIGVYEGPLVPVVAEHLVHVVRPGQIVIATGAVERHAVFPGSDVPGVWLGRGAARLAGAHGVSPARTAVVVGSSAELADHIAVLERAGVEIAAAVVSAGAAVDLPDSILVHWDAEVVAARGRRHVTGVRVRAGGSERTIACDGIVLSTGACAARQPAAPDRRSVGDRGRRRRRARLLARRSRGVGAPGGARPLWWPGRSTRRHIQGHAADARSSERRRRLPLRGRQGERPQTGLERRASARRSS